LQVFAFFLKKYMEKLRELFPHHSSSQLEDALQQCQGQLDDAANILFAASQTQETHDEQGASYQQPTNVNLPADCFTVSIFNRAFGSSRTKIWHETDCLPSFTTPCFYALADGNCGPHALGMMVTFLTGACMPDKIAEHRFVAKEIREYVSDFLFLNWTKHSKIAKEPWHEIVYFSHNLAITDEERDSYPDWGSDPTDRLERWIMERDSHFFTQSDFVCFNEAMQHYGVCVVFRIWRQVRSRLTRLATIPENAPTSEKHIVFDFKHTGKNDSGNAHWQLIQSGSAFFKTGTPRAPLVDYSGMDEPNEQKTGKKRKTEASTKALGKKRKKS
jgi:hypothetical protein